MTEFDATNVEEARTPNVFPHSPHRARHILLRHAICSHISDLVLYWL